MGFGSYDEDDQDAGGEKEVEGEDYTAIIKADDHDGEATTETGEDPFQHL